MKPCAVFQLKAGKIELATDGQAAFDSVLIRTATEPNKGHPSLAANRLGCVRNTLTHEIRELHWVF